MKNSPKEQENLITPESIYDQPSAPHLSSDNRHKNGLSAGAITGLAVGSVAVCALSFMAGMQVGGAQNNGMRGQAGGPPGMSQGQGGSQFSGSQSNGFNNQAGDPPGMSQGQNSQSGQPTNSPEQVADGTSDVGQGQTNQNAPTPLRQNNSNTAPNNQAGLPNRTGESQPPTANNLPQSNN